MSRAEACAPVATDVGPCSATPRKVERLVQLARHPRPSPAAPPVLRQPPAAPPRCHAAGAVPTSLSLPSGAGFAARQLRPTRPLPRWRRPRRQTAHHYLLKYALPPCGHLSHLASTPGAAAGPAHGRRRDPRGPRPMRQAPVRPTHRASWRPSMPSRPGSRWTQRALQVGSGDGRLVGAGRRTQALGPRRQDRRIGRQHRRNSCAAHLWTRGLAGLAPPRRHGSSNACRPRDTAEIFCTWPVAGSDG